jgi:hypothetical protein
MKPTLVLDFDGVLHSYTSGWQGAGVINDAPVVGAIEFLSVAVEDFEVNIYSSRSSSFAGRSAMRRWIKKHLFEYWGAHPVLADDIFRQIKFPSHKPPALVSIDDRAITYNGTFPSLQSLHEFKPWYRQEEETK